MNDNAPNSCPSCSCSPCACGRSCPGWSGLIMALTLCLFAGIFSNLAWSEASALKQARQNQEKPLEQLTDLRGKLDHIALATAKLADEGNANAKDLVARMKKAGVTIGAPAEAKKAP